MGGCFGGWGVWEKLKLKLTQPQVELEAWAELGNITGGYSRGN